MNLCLFLVPPLPHSLGTLKALIPTTEKAQANSVQVLGVHPGTTGDYFSE